MLALEDDDAVALGEALRTAGYGDDAGILPPDAEGAVLRRLFSLGAWVPRDAGERALGPGLVAALSAAGLLEDGGDRVRAVVRITPLEGLLFLHDPADPRGPADQVASVGPASETLADLMIRRPVESALDLGTGCGVQALLAARFCGHVVGTDVNERALAMARLNARVNGVTNVEFRASDLFASLGDATFDLIVANPPFVISPETSHVYRDSGLGGDELSRRVVVESARRLAPGGHATILCEWLLRDGQSWADTPRAWAADCPCDVLALHYRSAEPEAYAAGWNRPLRAVDADAYVAAVERWSAYQRDLGAIGVSTGAIVLRRREGGEPRFDHEEMPGGPRGVASDHLLRLLSGRDRLRELDGASLLDTVVGPVPGQVLTQRLVRGADGWATPDVEVGVDPGVGVQATVSPALVHVVLSLDGERPLDQVVEQAAEELGADVAQLRDQAGAAVERLVALGLLVVAD